MEEKIKKFLQDWIEKNPSIKKKFEVSNIFLLPNNLIEIQTTETTKKNLEFLKKHSKNILLYFFSEPKEIIFSNLFEKPDAIGILTNYLKSTNLKTENFVISEKKHTANFSEYFITLDLDVIELIYTKNLYFNSEHLFTYDKLDKKYRNTFQINFQFTSKLKNSIVEFNNRLQKYGQNKDKNSVFRLSSPTIGFFKIAPSVVTVFINGSTSNDYVLRKTIFNDFFDYHGVDQLKDWTPNSPKYHTYKRGPWVKNDEIAFGYVENEKLIFNYPIIQSFSSAFSNDSDQPT